MRTSSSAAAFNLLDKKPSKMIGQRFRARSPFFVDSHYGGVIYTPMIDLD